MEGPLTHLWADILNWDVKLKAYDSYRMNISHGGKAQITCYRINPKLLKSIVIEELFNRKDQSFDFLERTPKWEGCQESRPPYKSPEDSSTISMVCSGFLDNITLATAEQTGLGSGYAVSYSASSLPVHYQYLQRQVTYDCQLHSAHWKQVQDKTWNSPYI